MPNAGQSHLRRAARIGLCALAGAVPLLAIAAGAVLLVLGHLDSPAIKRRVVAAAARAGLALDYGEASVSASALHFTQLRLSQPPPDEALEPLLAVARIDLTYSAWGALFGGRVKLKSGRIEGVRAVVFADEDGATSITRLLARMPKEEAGPSPKKKPEPLSKTLAQLSNLAAEVHQFKLAGVSAAWIERRARAVVKQTELSGVELTASEPQGVLDVRIASPESGARIAVAEGGAKKEALADFHAELVWSARGKPPQGAFDLEAKLRRQDLIAMPPQAPAVKTLLSLHAGVTPEPADGRTRIVVEQLDLLEGAGSGHADADLFDDGKGGVKPSIHEVVLDLVLERLRPFIPTSQGKIDALSGGMNVRIFGIDLSKGLRIAPDGGAEIKAEIAQLEWTQAAQSAEVTRAKLSLQAKPAAGGAALELEMPIERVRLVRGRQSFLLSRAQVKAQAHATLAYRATGALTARLGAVKMVGAQTIDAEETGLRVSLQDADLAADGPLRIAGGVSAELDFGHLLANAGGLAVEASGLKLRAPMKLAPDAGSGAGEVHVEAAQLRLDQAGKPLLAPTTASADLALKRFQIDAEDAQRSTADAALSMAVGAVQLTLHADKKPRDLDYQLSAKATSLALARPFVHARNDDGSEQIPWPQLGLTLASQGSIGDLGGGNSLRIAEETTLGISRGALHADALSLAFAQLTATLKSRGTPLRQEAELSMQMTGLSVQDEPRPGDETLTLHAVIDRETSAAKVQLAAKGEAAPEGKIDLAFGFERAGARVAYAIDAELHRLDLVPILVPAVAAHSDLDWSTLGLALSGKGELAGVVTAMRDFKPRLAANPLESMRGAQGLDFRLTGLDYSNDQDQSLVLGSAALHLDAREEAQGKHLELTASAPAGELDAANVQAKFEALQLAAKVDLGKQSLRAELSMKLGALKQDALAAYPIGDASFAALVTAGADGAVHLERFTLDNVAGGTTLSASGVIEAMLQFTGGAPKVRPIHPGGEVGEERDLKMTGHIDQRLEALPPALGMSGRGTMSVPFGVESNDLRYFRVATGVELADADVSLPARKIRLSKLNAKIPVRLSFRLDDAGALPLGGARPGVYSRERFVDYQPFLSSEDFLSCETLAFGDTVMGPLAANLRVDRNVIALDQLELSAFGGKITGQFLLDLDLAQRQLTDVQFRGNVTGLAPGTGAARSSEVVDANAALRLNPKKLELEGRIDLIRIGRDDLRAMLDAWDPNHSDESANRTRQALLAGYPKDVRIGFHQGFTEVRMEMGGLAGFSKLDPIQLSTGPILQKYVAPYLKLTKPKAPVEPAPAVKAPGTP